MVNRYGSQGERVFIIRIPNEGGVVWRRARIEVKEVAATHAFDRRKVVSDVPAAFDVIAQWLRHPSKTDV
ncbi:hypothetical protein EFR00_28410 [Rhizobium sophoriradicis]|uniref:hypothetical protein n=1 Tax=Rhizobium sophoriradicis TaxID=1535245 RepID=UPI00098F73A4|nr:hypothetical protein [Rhizobium sophoriradicis]RSB86882.1 hypothetical protein EFR00_28410 [Rhizobium sophoriradicis]